MKKTRESLVYWGFLLLLIGVTLRVFDGIQLNQPSQAVVAHYRPQSAVYSSLGGTNGRYPIPRWSGWLAMVAGGVLLAESLVTPKGGA